MELNKTRVNSSEVEVFSIMSNVAQEFVSGWELHAGIKNKCVPY